MFPSATCSRGAAKGIPDYRPFFEMGDGRLTGASIAGLVVGAMGMFVFTVALRHWLRERRAIMELEASERSMQQWVYCTSDIA